MSTIRIDKRDSVRYTPTHSQVKKDLYITFENNLYHAWSKWNKPSAKATLLFTSMTPIRIEWDNNKQPKLITLPPAIVDIAHCFLRDKLKGQYEGQLINTKLMVECLNYGKMFSSVFAFRGANKVMGTLPANIYEARTALTNAIETVIAEDKQKAEEPPKKRIRAKALPKVDAADIEDLL